MDVLLAAEITLATLVSSNAPERLAGQVEWDGTPAWPASSVVTREATRRVYKAAFDVPAGGVPPEENIAVAQLPFWVDVGAMNQWAMFDKAVGTQTIGPPGDLIVVFRPGAITDFWLGNLSDVTVARVQVKDKTGGVFVYDETRSLRQPVDTYWDWWFAPFVLAGDAPFTGIPAYRNCEVTLTLSAGESGQAKIGMAAAGKIENQGTTEWGVEAEFRRYTPGIRSQSWGPTQSGGEIAKEITYQIFVKPADAPRVDKFTKQAMKRLAVFMPSGRPEFEGIRIFGEMISARMGYPGPNHVPFDITVREFL